MIFPLISLKFCSLLISYLIPQASAIRIQNNFEDGIPICGPNSVVILYQECGRIIRKNNRNCEKKKDKRPKYLGMKLRY